MARHRATRYGICGSGGFLSIIPFPIPSISSEPFIDILVRAGISFGIGFGVARILKWDDE